MRVIDLMTSDVVTVTPETGLKEAARLMVQASVSGLPVVDETGTVIGIITEADFLRREAERGESPGLLEALFHRHDVVAEAETVGEVMTQQPVVIDGERPLTVAARIMVKRGVKRLPVVDTDGRIVGVISRADIVNSFARPDEVLEDAIREDIVRQILWIEPDAVDIEVEEGVVTLEGTLPTRSEARFFEELVSRLEGVVAVDSRLRWETDDTKEAAPLT